jgi:uncharacterized protein
MNTERITVRNDTHRSPSAAASLMTTLAAALLLAALTAACRPGAVDDELEYLPLIRFDTASAVIVTATDTVPLSVELAEREDQRSYGLMERASLPQDAGMIFLYGSEQPADAGFWMYRTRIPLDIAFLDEEGTILTILAMEPCPDVDPRGCRSYPPGVPYYSALEVNRGWFAQRGVGVGDRVILQRQNDSAVR